MGNSTKNDPPARRVLNLLGLPHPVGDWNLYDILYVMMFVSILAYRVAFEPYWVLPKPASSPYFGSYLFFSEKAFFYALVGGLLGVIMIATIGGSIRSTRQQHSRKNDSGEVEEVSMLKWISPRKVWGVILTIWIISFAVYFIFRVVTMIHLL